MQNNTQHRNKCCKEAFTTTFIETTKDNSELDFLEIESKWINKLQPYL